MDGHEARRGWWTSALPEVPEPFPGVFVEVERHVVRSDPYDTSKGLARLVERLTDREQEASGWDWFATPPTAQRSAGTGREDVAQAATSRRRAGTEAASGKEDNDVRLSESAQRMLIAAGTPRRWAAGGVLMREADTAEHVVLVLRGRVKVLSTGPGGRQVLLAIRGPGELLGEAGAIHGGARSATVVALTDIDAVMLSAVEFQRCVESVPVLAWELLRLVVRRLQESTRRRLERRTSDVKTRTAEVLVDLALSHGGEPEERITVNVRQGDIATAVGASRAAVKRALKVFQDAGAVRTSPDGFELLRFDLLREYAEVA